MNYSIQIVLVLYGCELSKSISFKSIEKILQSRRSTVDYDLLIYNNDKTINISHPTYVVVNSSTNKMLAGAYSFALNRAVETDKQWLLLVDQDTEISENYFNEIEDFLLNNCNDNVVAVVPFLVSHTRVVSPEITRKYLWYQDTVSKPGIYQGRISGFNSMSLLNVKFLSKIGGFNEDYPLDMLDHWVYSQINKSNKKVYVVNVKINHQLSLLDKDNYMPLTRYKNFLLAEKRFVKEELTVFHYLSYKLRLIPRIGHQLIRFNNKRYAWQTLKTFMSL